MLPICLYVILPCCCLLLPLLSFLALFHACRTTCAYMMCTGGRRCWRVAGKRCKLAAVSTYVVISHIIHTVLDSMPLLPASARAVLLSMLTCTAH